MGQRVRTTAEFGWPAVRRRAGRAFSTAVWELLIQPLLPLLTTATSLFPGTCFGEKLGHGVPEAAWIARRAAVVPHRLAAFRALATDVTHGASFPIQSSPARRASGEWNVRTSDIGIAIGSRA